MQAVRAIVHPKGNTVSIAIPATFMDLDIEIVAFPASEPKRPHTIFPPWPGNSNGAGMR